MIIKQHQLSQRRQCQLLNIARSRLYYQPAGESELNQKLMRLFDEQYLKTPFYGARQFVNYFEKKHSIKVSRKRIRRLMKRMGLQAIYCEPKTSIPDQQHKVYPYLLRKLKIERANHVWCADITYVPMEQGHLYLVAVMDWATRKVLSWRLSNTLDSQFCIEALKEAIDCFGCPEIFNTDQGSQFTDNDFTGVLKANTIQISMDGKGRWMDNVFIERLWRSYKYECVYLNAFASVKEASSKTAEWIDFYNTERCHSSLANLTPDEAYSAGDRHTA